MSEFRYKRLDDRNLLGTILFECGLHGFGVEIGVATGKFSEIILKNFGLNKVYLVDSWTPYTVSKGTIPQSIQDVRYNTVLEKMKGYGDKVEIIRNTSELASKLFTDNFFDFVYVDASHAYVDIQKDLKLWYPKVKVGGLFSGHDYVPNTHGLQFDGVKKAVDEFAEEHNTKIYVTGGTWRIPPSWYLIKGS